MLLIVFLCQSCSSGNKRIESINFTSNLGYVVQGEGRPSVIFEANFGDSHEVWTPVLQKISKVTKVFAYTRNFGSSGSSKDGFTKTLTSYEIALNLRKRLKSNAVEPPFVIVAHSYAGLYALKFAELYPKDTAGVVLVDGRPAEFSSSCQQLKLGNCTTPYLIQSLQAPKDQQEIRGLPETESITPSGQKLGALPVTVITATVPSKTRTREYQEHWIRSQEEFARSLKNGKLVTALGAGHNIHRSRPDLVVKEIKDLISRLDL
ncbi:MAG: alpha/beta fold hydrolase [Methyloligellaceae bacterium]